MAVGFSRNAELIKQIRGKLPHFGGIVTPIHCCPSEPGGGDRIKISKHSSEVWSLSAMSTKRIKSMRRKSTFSVQLITKHEGESRRRTLLDSQKGNHMGQWGSAQIVGIVPHLDFQQWNRWDLVLASDAHQNKIAWWVRFVHAQDLHCGL